MFVAPDRTVQAASTLRAVRIWLGIVAALIVCTLLVGGATRLTESGLSIVEWKPVTGTLPPLSQAEWSAEFEAYKKIPQYREMNQGMALGEFKMIYWWEWTHRALARFIGVAFLLPFLWFLWRRAIAGDLMRRLWVLFALGGLQGAVGWWMVKSGLAARTSVSQYRLAVHFMLALLLFSAVVWTVRRLQTRPSLAASVRMKITGWLLLALVFLQLYFGALVAGLRAGKIFNTWPNIDGVLIPSFDRLFFETPWWRNFFDNMLTVQFSHRVIAYVLLAVSIFHVIDAIRSRAGSVATNGALWLLVAIIVQVAIGVATLLYQVPIDMGIAHQANAIVVLTLTLLQAERLSATLPKTISGRVGVAAG